MASKIFRNLFFVQGDFVFLGVEMLPRSSLWPNYLISFFQDRFLVTNTTFQICSVYVRKPRQSPKTYLFWRLQNCTEWSDDTCCYNIWTGNVRKVPATLKSTDVDYFHRSWVNPRLVMHHHTPELLLLRNQMLTIYADTQSCSYPDLWSLN